MTSITIEHGEQLTTDEFRALKCLVNNTGSSLDELEAFLRVAFRSWFVYRGGNHVALHKVSGSPRVLFVTAAR
jgi:hypothetical protein